MAFEVPPLPYDFDALEPHIDAKTMEIHHDKHHQAYVDKVNAALEGTDFDGKPIEEVLQNLDALPSDKQKAVRNNGGGHYNHSLFWEWMSPDGGGEPDGALADAIGAAFGSFSDFQAKFKETGVNQFGSGWAWVAPGGGGGAGRGSCAAGAGWRAWARPTRTTRSPRARRRCWASTSGSTRTTSSTRTSAP